jgi:predicted nucleic-acid-binding Zn-ribbon protein
MQEKMNTGKYQCPKCGGKKAEVDKIRVTGAGFTKFFNIQNRKFTAVSCAQCGYTELWREGKSSGASNVLDFITG